MAAVSITYPSLPVIIPSARLLSHDVLAGSPRVDDIELIVTELITNTIQHVPAGKQGGIFTLTIRTGSTWTSVEVTDADDDSRQYNPGIYIDSGKSCCGLVIVAALADRLS